MLGGKLVYQKWSRLKRLFIEVYLVLGWYDTKGEG